VGVLDGRRVVVIGASAGIGRAFAKQAVADGATVLAAARRADKLAELLDEAGAGIAAPVDICSADDCDALADTVRREIGEVDVVLHAAASSPLKLLTHMTTDDWLAVMRTNLIGVQHVIRALLPTLAPGAIVGVLSSEAIGQPRAGLGAYASSKAALEESLRAWHAEHPGVRFSCIAVGSTVPTEFGIGFEMGLLTQLLEEWARHGLAQERMMAVDDLGDALVKMVAAVLPYPEVNLEHVLVRSPSGVVGSAQGLIDTAENLRAG
jgi:NAD(P)-dependent dehydrogenase (short-subunit alcohol dehydrogenase family)